MNTLTTIFAIIGFIFVLFCVICFLIGVIDYFKNYPCGFCNCEDCLDNENALIDIQPTDDKCHYCEHNFTPYKGNTGEFEPQEADMRDKED